MKKGTYGGAKVCRRKIRFNYSSREAICNIFKWSYEVTISGNQTKHVRRTFCGVGNHPHRNVNIGSFFLWTRNCCMTIRTLNLFIKIFTPHNLKAVAINQFIGVKKRTLAFRLSNVKWRRGKIYNLCKLLIIAKKLFKKLNKVNPVCALPRRIGLFCSMDSIIKIESIYIKYNFLHIKKKCRSQATLFPTKKGGGCVLFCKCNA